MFDNLLFHQRGNNACNNTLFLKVFYRYGTSDGFSSVKKISSDKYRWTVGTASPFRRPFLVHCRMSSLATVREWHRMGGRKLQVLSSHRLGEALRTQCNNAILRLTACMVLIATDGASHASGMAPNRHGGLEDASCVSNCTPSGVRARIFPCNRYNPVRI